MPKALGKESQRMLILAHSGCQSGYSPARNFPSQPGPVSHKLYLILSSKGIRAWRRGAWLSFCSRRETVDSGVLPVHTAHVRHVMPATARSFAAQRPPTAGLRSFLIYWNSIKLGNSGWKSICFGLFIGRNGLFYGIR